MGDPVPENCGCIARVLCSNTEGVLGMNEIAPRAIPLRQRLQEVVALLALLGMVARQQLLERNAVVDWDLWWHLRVGRWITENFAVPQTGLFSRTVGDRPWVAYSWGFEVLLSRAEHWFGLSGVVLFCDAMVMVVAFAIFWMLRRLSGQFWTALLLATVAMWAIYHNTSPRPVLFSITFFAVILALVLEANRTGDVRGLYWLPAIFLVWSNIHIQFIYGLFLVTLFVGVAVAQQIAQTSGETIPFLRVRETPLPLAPLGLVYAGCVAATLIGPYSIKLYRVVLIYAQSQIAYDTITELQALSFRTGAHYVQLLLVAAGFFALGRSRKGIDLFKALLLTIATVVAFRTTRDSWFVCVPCVAVIAEQCAGEQREASASYTQRGIEFVAALLMLVLMGRVYNINEASLKQTMATRLPVSSADFIKSNGLPGPLYNTLNYGGYLIWALPNHPVSIDGRNDLYGDQIDLRYWNVLRGLPEWQIDPDIESANTLLVDRGYPLVDAIAGDRRFRLVHIDECSAVFIRVRGAASAPNATTPHPDKGEAK
jgi:hypothetical protein